MGWIQRLYETYENNLEQVGKIEEDRMPLLPICHTMAKAHVEITIDPQGGFIAAKLLGKDEKPVIVPCSENSAGRAGKYPAPHPLCDKIQYLAGDYLYYGGTKWHGYKNYLETLEKWVSSNYSHPKAQAIYDYVSKGTLMSDLIQHRVLTVDEKQKLNEKWDKEVFTDIPNTAQGDVFIRFKVEDWQVLESTTWLDMTLFKAWEAYYLNSQEERAFCQVLGKEAPTVSNHPKNIYSLCANAKIISSNDSSGYTFRGRFAEAQECYGISYEVSQKAHNALKWLITRQGYNHEKKTIVCWRTSGKALIEPWVDSYEAAEAEEEEAASNVGYTAEEIAYKLKLKFQGYHSKMDPGDQVIIMALESVTDGRLSITYYQEMDNETYLGRLEKWHSTCKWIHEYREVEEEKDGIKRKKHMRFIGAPSPTDITETVYGEKVDEKQKRSTNDRIIFCIAEGLNIPKDLVEMAFRKAVNRAAFDDAIKYEKTLSIACALINKYCHDNKKEAYDMALETERRSRDYLYGRLLAVAQGIEQMALKDSGEKRLTNAERYFQRFADHPATTWLNIEKSLQNYREKNKDKGTMLEEMLDQIMQGFDPEEFCRDDKLGVEFLLAYHCQKAAIRDVH